VCKTTHKKAQKLSGCDGRGVERAATIKRERLGGDETEAASTEATAHAMEGGFASAATRSVVRARDVGASGLGVEEFGGVTPRLLRRMRERTEGRV
jgi:hypothetical protein